MRLSIRWPSRASSRRCSSGRSRRSHPSAVTSITCSPRRSGTARPTRRDCGSAAPASPRACLRIHDAATAVAEITFHRLLFFADSPATPWPGIAGEYTVFLVRFRTTAGLDLTLPPLSADRIAGRTSRTTLRARTLPIARARQASMCSRHAVGPRPGRREPRAAGVRRLRWRVSLRSVRPGASISARTAPARFVDFPEARLEFHCQAFAADARVARLAWER